MIYRKGASRPKALLVATAVLGLAGAMTVFPSRATSATPDAGKIAFTSMRDGNYEIYLMNADGTDQTRLTDNLAADADPAFSPAGTKIAFASTRDGAWQIYVMNADGTGQTRLTNDTYNDNDPSWSPDGSKIAFTSDRDTPGAWQIFVMDADGTNQIRLTNTSAVNMQPAWSPDGTKIAFTSLRDGNTEVYVMNADGSSQVNLVNDAPGAWGDDDSPAWSPDGTKIAFRTGRPYIGIPSNEEHFEIYVMNADGSNPTRLTNDWYGDSDPAWSPDGSKIAFSRSTEWGGHTGPPVEIFVMNADGSDLTPLTNNSVLDYGPTWAPTGIRFSGFGEPVTAEVLNTAKAGQAIPLKFRLTDYFTGSPITDLTTVTVRVTSLACTLGTTTDQIEEYASGGSGLQNLGDGYYQYNWKTPKSYANSCKTMTLHVGPGADFAAAFSFSK